MEYFQRQLANRRELYRKQTLARLENQVFPFLGDIPVSSIKPTHILAGLREVEARGSVNMAHRLASLIRLVLSYAVACGYAEFNAAAEVKETMAPMINSMRWKIQLPWRRTSPCPTSSFLMPSGLL